VLEQVGMVTRSKSSGDGRRRYVHLVRSPEPPLASPPRRAGKALFVCTRNSARSQLAAALWRSMTGAGADSAGTHPASSVHPGAVAAAQRAGLDLGTSATKSLSAIRNIPRLVVTVCDQAHEELDAGIARLHWSVPDPVADGRRIAFDHVLVELRNRIGLLAATPLGTR
ncbi:MAG TPA: hypothetical protein VLD86_17795, partial [Ilumatobacteraceae bacterium]|nr:hypothetical protein [Ilumatobacteraceae bacterium]